MPSSLTAGSSESGMGKLDFVSRFVEAVAKTFERGALTVFFLGASGAAYRRGSRIRYRRMAKSNKTIFNARTSGFSEPTGADGRNDEYSGQQGGLSGKISSARTESQIRGGAFQSKDAGTGLSKG